MSSKLILIISSYTNSFFSETQCINLILLQCYPRTRAIRWSVCYVVTVCSSTVHKLRVNWNQCVQEMEDAVKRRQVEVVEIDRRLQQQYENRLAETLQQIRDENNEIIRRNRAEVEAVYEKKVNNNLLHHAS